MRRIEALRMRDRLKRLTAQIEGVSWSDGQIKAKWVFEQLAVIQGDVDSATWDVLTFEQRDSRGRFK